MKCPNCGGKQTPSIKENYLKCMHCGTITANKMFLNNLMQSSLGDSINDFEILNAHEDYVTLKDVSYSKIKINPQNWMAYFYFAISEYWLGGNNFKHIDSVLSNLDKSFQISHNPIILEYKKALIISTISLASCNKPYGEELTNSLKAFEYEKSENVELTADVQSQKVEYCTLAIEKIINALDVDLANKKSSFDITYVNLKNIFSLAKVTNNLNHFEKYYLFSKFHLDKHKYKSYAREIDSDIKYVEKILSERNSSILNKRITFNFFGKLLIKE